jgi:hypothetical protein
MGRGTALREANPPLTPLCKGGKFLRLIILLALGALPSSASAHVLDEYLQSILVAIEPDDIRLKINLTPGVEIADKVLAQIDRNRDGAISADEGTAYAAQVKSDLTVRLDGRESGLNLTAANFPELPELRTGHGFMQLEFALAPGSLAAGTYNLSVENRHVPALSVYLFNAAQPKSAAIQIAKQTRNQNQSTGQIEFTVHGPASLSNGGRKCCAPCNVPRRRALAPLSLRVADPPWWKRRRG